MGFCVKCGNENHAASKFCGNCGASLEHAKTSAKQAPAENTETESYGKGADAIIAFFSGRSFMVLVTVFAAIGIVYAVFTGGLSTSSIPSPAESYMMRDGWSPMGSRQPRPQARPRSPDNSNARRRFDAYQRQRGNN